MLQYLPLNPFPQIVMVANRLEEKRINEMHYVIANSGGWHLSFYKQLFANSGQ